MSYILDALRRADAERQRGSVPGLHHQPLDSALEGAQPAPDTRSRRLGLGALALVLLALAGAAGWLLRPAAPAAAALPGAVPGAAAVEAALPLPQMPAPQMPASQMPAPQLPASPLPEPRSPAQPSMALPVPPPPSPQALAAAAAALPPSTVRPAALPRRPALVAAQAATPNAAPAAAPAAARAAAPPISPPTSPPAPALSPAPPAAAALPARLPTLADLPDAQKRELGPLVVGGAMHAEQAALRIVILNGQVVHEGDKLGPDLQVQQIRLKSVVLSHRGQRFELPF